MLLVWLRAGRVFFSWTDRKRHQTSQLSEGEGLASRASGRRLPAAAWCCASSPSQVSAGSGSPSAWAGGLLGPPPAPWPAPAPSSCPHPAVTHQPSLAARACQGTCGHGGREPLGTSSRKRHLHRETAAQRPASLSPRLCLGKNINNPHFD